MVLWWLLEGSILTDASESPAVEDNIDETSDDLSMVVLMRKEREKKRQVNKQAKTVGAILGGAFLPVPAASKSSSSANLFL